MHSTRVEDVEKGIRKSYIMLCVFCYCIESYECRFDRVLHTIRVLSTKFKKMQEKAGLFNMVYSERVLWHKLKILNFQHFLLRTKIVSHLMFTAVCHPVLRPLHLIS